jgi:predicted MPP superfamily phosphohydrolase
VRGNHDFEGGRDELIRGLLDANGITLLDFAAHTIDPRRLVLVGIESPWRKGHIPETAAGLLPIALTHSPDTIFELAAHGVPLVIAGHTHGGKLCLPGLGPVLLASRIGRFLDRGCFVYQRTLLWITQGIGYFPGLRGNHGEILSLQLIRPRLNSLVS